MKSMMLEPRENVDRLESAGLNSCKILDFINEASMRRPFQSALIALTLAPAAVVAQAPELRPISEYLLLPADRRDSAYPILRCIGLFQGMFRYGGANFSEEDALRTQLSNEAMGLVALLLRQEKYPEADINELAGQIGMEIDSLSAVYSERMKSNFSLTGEAWGSDAIVGDDFETCGPIAQESVDFASKLSK